MRLFLLILMLHLVPALQPLEAQVIVRLSPASSQIHQPATDIPVAVEVQGVSQLHSLSFDLNLPLRVSLQTGSDQAGEFLSSAGGTPVKLLTPGTGKITVALALLGTGNDVSGSGAVFRATLRLADVPKEARSVTLTNVRLKSTNGSDITVAQTESLTLSTSRTPRLRLESTATRLSGNGQQVDVNVVGLDLVDLHSFAFDLPYNSQALTATSVTEGAFLRSGGGQTMFLSQLPANKVHVASALLGEGKEPTGTGTLASIRFTAASVAQLPTTLNVLSLAMKDSVQTDWTTTVVAESLTLLPEGQDNDSDGLPDTWEAQHFGSSSDPRAQPGNDIDGDGHTNLFEYIAGLDPNSRDSRFRVEMRKPDSGGGMWVGYAPITAGRLFTVEWTDLQGSGWQTMTPNTTEDHSGLHWVRDANAPERRFYRVKIQLP